MYGKPMHFIDWLIDMPEEFSFWVEDQIAVMSPVTIAVAIVVALVILAGIWLLVVSAAKKDVRNTSEILAGVEEVNQGYEFYDVDEEIRIALWHAKNDNPPMRVRHILEYIENGEMFGKDVLEYDASTDKWHRVEAECIELV